MQQAASLNRVKLAHGNCWKKIRTLTIAKKEDFSVLHCLLSALKKKTFIHRAAIRYLTLPQGEQELIPSSFMSAGVKLEP